MSNEEIVQMRKAQVLGCLFRGRDMAVSRGWISMHTRLNDRTVREIIEALRNEGYLICNDQNGGGYYLAETNEEIMRQYRRDCARAMSILRRLKPFRHAVRLIQEEEERSDQLTIEEILGLMGDKI